MYMVFLFLAVGCQSLEVRLKNSGSTVPRNANEKIIKDYFYALREQRYAEAYQLLSWHAASIPHSPPRFSDFKNKHQRDHKSLATQIAIGEKNKLRNDDPCGYIYTVYAIQPNHSVLFSGDVSLHSRPNQLGVCLIGYNSAFGSSP